MSRPKALRPCMWWERPGSDRHPGFFHQVIVRLMQLPDKTGWASVHMALVEDEHGITYTVDCRNLHFMDVDQ